jgi:hypothetical protein
MEYQGFVVETLEKEPGNWRAKISRPSGMPLIMIGRKRILQFVTGIDATTASAALLMALEAIDAGTFSSATPLREKFWRRRGQRSDTSDRAAPRAKRGTRNSIEQTRFGRANTAEQSNK